MLQEIENGLSQEKLYQEYEKNNKFTKRKILNLNKC